VLVSQELLDEEPPWEMAGLHLIEQGGFTEPGMRWCLFADDNAPAELNGKRVEPVFTKYDDGRVEITERRVTG
jgi:hypothetical protein